MKTIKQNIVGIGDFQLIIPKLNSKVGQEYIILDTKKNLIVGKVKVVKAPKEFSFTEQYKRKEFKKKGEKNGKSRS